MADAIRSGGLAELEGAADPGDPARGARPRGRLRSLAPARRVRRGGTRLPDVAPGRRPEDGRGRAVVRARARRDPGRHARASRLEAARPGPAERRRPSARTGCCTSSCPTGCGRRCTSRSSGWAVRSARRRSLAAGSVRSRTCVRPPRATCERAHRARGAGEGNRTPVSSLGSLRSAIEPHPREPLRTSRKDHKCSERRASGATCYVSAPMAELDPDFWPHTLSRVIAHQALTTEEAAEAMRVIMSGEASPGPDRRVPDGAPHQGRDRRRARGSRRDGARVRESGRGRHAGRRHLRHRRRPERHVQHLDGRGDRRGRRGGPGGQARQPRGLVALRLGRPARGARRQDRPRRRRASQRCLAEAGIGFMFAPVFHPAAGARRRRCGASSACPRSSTSSARSRTPLGRSRRWSGCRTNACCRSWPRSSRGAGSGRRCSAARTGWTSSPRPASPRCSTSATATSERGISIPATLGLARADLDDLRGGDAAEGAAIARSVLDGEPGPRRDVVAAERRRRARGGRASAEPAGRHPVAAATRSTPAPRRRPSSAGSHGLQRMSDRRPGSITGR